MSGARRALGHGRPGAPRPLGVRRRSLRALCGARRATAAQHHRSFLSRGGRGRRGAHTGPLRASPRRVPAQAPAHPLGTQRGSARISRLPDGPSRSVRCSRGPGRLRLGSFCRHAHEGTWSLVVPAGTLASRVEARANEVACSTPMSSRLPGARPLAQRPQRGSPAWNDCPSCHVAWRAEDRRPGTLVQRATDAQGLYFLTAVLSNTGPFERYRVRHPSAEDPFVHVRYARGSGVCLAPCVGRTNERRGPPRFRRRPRGVRRAIMSALAAGTRTWFAVCVAADVLGALHEPAARQSRAYCATMPAWRPRSTNFCTLPVAVFGSSPTK